MACISVRTIVGLRGVDEVRFALPGALIGLSCGTIEEITRANAVDVDYLGIGCVFPTASKADAGAPIGIDGLRALAGQTRLPVAAIGGITSQNVAEVRATGVAMAAVISAVAAARDPRGAAGDARRRVGTADRPAARRDRARLLDRDDTPVERGRRRTRHRGRHVAGDARLHGRRCGQRARSPRRRRPACRARLGADRAACRATLGLGRRGPSRRASQRAPRFAPSPLSSRAGRGFRRSSIPVFAASRGGELGDEAARAATRDELGTLPNVILTPNLDEAAWLLGVPQIERVRNLRRGAGASGARCRPRFCSKAAISPASRPTRWRRPRALRCLENRASAVRCRARDARWRWR